MISMENLSNNIADKITLELDIDNNNREIIAYGIFALLNIIISIFLVMICGLMFGICIEALVVSFSGSILRKYSGGVHASTPGICAFAGTFIAVGLALLASNLIIPLIDLKIFIILVLIAFAYSYYFIYKLAPVDSVNKPIKTEKKRKRMKKVSILVLVTYTLIIVLNIVMYIRTNERKFLTFSLCICGGTSWQAFSLTDTGHLIFREIDTFFCHILTFVRGKE